MGRFNRNRVHNGIHRHSRKLFLLLKGYAEFVKCLYKLRINLVKAFRPLLLNRGGIIAYRLEIYIGHVQMRPFRGRKRKPVAERLQSEIKHPVRLPLFPGYQPDHILVKPYRDNLGVDIGDKTIFIVPPGHLVKQGFVRALLPETVLIVGMALSSHVFVISVFIHIAWRRKFS